MTRAAQNAGRRLPTAEQARRVAQRAEEILGEWHARGLPTLAAIEVGLGDAVGLRETGELVGLGERRVVAGRSESIGDQVVVESAGPGETSPPVGDHPDTDPRGTGLRQRLDVPGMSANRRSGPA